MINRKVTRRSLGLGVNEKEGGRMGGGERRLVREGERDGFRKEEKEWTEK